ncbi:hypothetical protein IJ135_00845 [Candidatus Saccharibacteria bacterium]|nr:hypothetical protein [Candidatus Saccharibacteria bacterium]
MEHLDKTELEKIIQQFDVPPLIFLETKKVGPDEYMYFMSDAEDNHFVVWVRDNMSELEYETNYLDLHHKVKVVKWFGLKEDKEIDTIYSHGYIYAVGLI